MNEFFLHMFIATIIFGSGFGIFHLIKSNTMTSFFSFCFAALSLYFFVKHDNPLFYVGFLTYYAFSTICTISVFFRFSYRPQVENFWKWVIFGRMLFSFLFIASLIWMDSSILNMNTEHVDVDSILSAGGLSFLIAAITLKNKTEKDS